MNDFEMELCNFIVVKRIVRVKYIVIKIRVWITDTRLDRALGRVIGVEERKSISNKEVVAVFILIH